MQKIKSYILSNIFILTSLLFVVSGVVYLIFIPKFGYFNDDWYLMYAAGSKGAAIFKDIYEIDRPLRAYVMMPAFAMFGNDPLYWNISAWFFRVLSAVFFFWSLRILWPGRQKTNWSIALLYLIYPGFLSQFNGIDYQAQMISLAAGMLSLVLVVKACKSRIRTTLFILFLFLTFLTSLYLGLVEYFIGLEVFKLACIFVLSMREKNPWFERMRKAVFWCAYSLLALLPFLIWRFYFFKSERGATDVDLQFDGILSAPGTFLLNWISTLLQDITDVLLNAWIYPLYRLAPGMASHEWLVGAGIAILVLFIIWVALDFWVKIKDEGWDSGPNWRWEAVFIGVVVIISGLLPVILVGRSVDFRSFSRYSLAPSVGVVLIWQAGLAFLSNNRIKHGVFALLVVSASFTHYLNGLARVRDTRAMQDFWWQVSWRIPQLEQGTTLLAHNPTVTVEEDYFVWGPANLIYYPESMHADYPQPGIYSVVMNEDTIEKIFAREGQEFSNRRSIRTYPNYRNILILTQPTPDSCVHVIDGFQPEISGHEDQRYIQVAASSEVEHILVEAAFHKPPLIPFGPEPQRGWCFYYEKAAFARQLGDWDEVLRLGDEAFDMGMSPKDQIEWMPFIQAYAVSGDWAGLSEQGVQLTDSTVRDQACQILGDMKGLPGEMPDQTRKLFCSD